MNRRDSDGKSFFSSLPIGRVYRWQASGAQGERVKVRVEGVRDSIGRLGIVDSLEKSDQKGY